MMETTPTPRPEMSTPTTTTTTMKPQPEGPNFCIDGHVDAITMTFDTETVYSFSGEYYSILDDSGVRYGYPRRIRDDWRGLPSSVDAALSLKEL